jgi:hypothetical protein
MSIGLTDSQMVCNETGHTAQLGEEGWAVSWLPGRSLTRDEAITAMVLGEAAGRDPEPGSALWAAAESWAGELGLPNASAAIRMARPTGRELEAEAG